MRTRASLLTGLSALALTTYAACDGAVVDRPELPPTDTSDADILVPDTSDTSIGDTADTSPADVDTSPEDADTSPPDADTSPEDTADADTSPEDTADTSPEDTTDADTSPADPCVPNPCQTPPDRCDGEVLERFASPGTCVDNNGAAECEYALLSAMDCAETQQVCSAEARACVFPDLPLAIESTSPANDAGEVDDGAVIAITFNQVMNAATLTGQTTAGACSGSLQLSFDNFTSCVPFTAAAASLSADGKTATVVPRVPLTWGLSYSVRVGSTVAGGNGRTLGAAQTFTFRTGAFTACGGARVVISQVYGGGGGSGLFSHDFVELKNRTAEPVSLAGWSLQYGSNSGSTWSRFALEGVIPAGGYWLVQLSSSGSNANPLPTPDQTGTLNLAQASGKVALVAGPATLAAACPTSPAIIDLIGYGAANCSEGAPAAVATATTGVHRRAAGCADTANNLDNTLITAPRPRNSAAAPAFCGCAADLEATGTDAADRCQLVSPATISVAHGAALPEVLGRVFEAGLTDTTEGQAPGVLAQLGIGPQGTDPVGHAAWAYYNGSFRAELGADDEYVATLPSPASTTTAPARFAYTWRVSLDGGERWTWCDLDGDGAFDPTRLGALTLGGSACDPNPCTSPGQPICQGDVLLTPAATGTCNVVDSAPQCAYPTVPTDCAALGLRCDAGACVAVPDEPLVLTSSSPADGATGVSVDEIIVLTFDRALDPATVSTVATTGACAGTIQVSFDNFASCVGVEAALEDGDTSVWIAPDAFAHGVTYQVRVSTGLRSLLGHQLGAALTQTFTTAPAALCDGPAAVISQVYAGGGAVGASFANDFIELKNRTGEALVLEGWSLQVLSASGRTTVSLRGTLEPHGFHLVQLAGGAGPTLPSPDQTATVDLGAEATILLASTMADAACTGPAVLDRVAYGSNACGSESLPAPAVSSAWARDVLGCSAIGTASADFIRVTPTPRHGASAPVACACTDDMVANDFVGASELELDACALAFPPSLAVAPGAASDFITGAFFHAGLTTQPGQAPGLKAQLGFGPAGSDPTAQRHWAFFDGAFAGEDGDDDQYEATLPGAALIEGQRPYAYTWRVSRDGGQSWTYCDLDGAGRADGLDFSPAELGLLVVGAQCTRDEECQAGGVCDLTNFQCGYAPLTVGYCRLHAPTSAEVELGADVTLAARILVPGLTDQSTLNDLDPLGRLVVQAGYGQTGSLPTSDGWSWGGTGTPEAGYVGFGPDLLRDGYLATVRAATSGAFDMALRVSGDGGATWLYCDTDGATDLATYSPAQAGALTVGGPPAAIMLYSQDFDSLPNSTTPAPSLALFSAALPGWAFMAENTNAFQVGTGSGTSGGFHSFGAADSTERALGGLGSNSTNALNWGVCYTNTGERPLGELVVSYVGEQWRAGNAAAQSLQFSYSLSLTPETLAANLRADTAWTRVAALDFVSPTTGTGGAINGNADANRTALSHTLDTILPVGASLCVRWRDLNDSGNDHGLAIDDLALTGLPQ